MSTHSLFADRGEAAPAARAGGLAPETDAPTDAPVRPRTLTVLGLLALTALTFSYLGSYAVYNALVTAKLADGWHGNVRHFDARGLDDRPR